MRIALTADPELPVPPRLYGGIERVVDMLAQGLVAQGHDVTLFAHRGSRTSGRLVPWPGLSSRSIGNTVLNSATLSRHVAFGQFDLVHSFSRIAYMMPLLPLGIPKLMSYQRPVAERSIRAGHMLSRGSLWFSAISRQMMGGVNGTGTWRLVYNGVPIDTYHFSRDPGPNPPFVFLGRIEQIKGPHIAIEVARQAGAPLVIAGNIPDEHRNWFDSEIAPHLDGKNVTYVGPVDDAQKNALLGTARALLMPILWDEPFGIVMAEAMACGTPVIGFGRGSVPEVVDHGTTGFVCDDVPGLVDAARCVDKLDRGACRKRVELLFSDAAVVEGYLAVYREMLLAARSSDTTPLAK